MPTPISLLSDHHTLTALMPAILTSPGIKGHKIAQHKTGSPEEGIMDLIHSLVTSDPNHKDPFYVLDLAHVVDLFNKWTHHLPTVRPFYAVKCNPSPALLSTLAALGASFDCASRREIEAVLALGVSPDRIIYANPCKPEPHIAYAAKAGVGLTTFDSVYELDKIRRHHPGCSLLLRLKAPDDNGALRPLGTKYGALPEEVSPLLLAAEAASLPVIGMSFHVGSGATNFGTYDTAIRSARAAFDAADQLGLPRMHVLNVGGGFTAGRQFEEAATVIRASIEAHFGGWGELEVIAEPGRIMAETAFTLATCVIGKRVRGERREYWINDGIHGSMACIKNDTTAGVEVAPVAAVSDPGNVRCHGKKTHRSTVFGPTCDALDMVLAGVQLPELEVGDWLVSPNMGAYTASLGSSFNGFDTSAIRVILANSSV